MKRKKQIHKDVYDDTVWQYIRKDPITLPVDTTVETVFEIIRTDSIYEQINYLYVIDKDGKLTGVLPLRRLVSANREQSISELMLTNIVMLSDNDTLVKAQHYFETYRLLSLPVVNDKKEFQGVLDVTVISNEDLKVSDNLRFDTVFEIIGVRASILPFLTPMTSFRYRFPWLIPTLIGGIASAVLTSFFESTIAQSIILAFFLTLILGLGESVSVQTLTITIRRLRVERPTLKWYLKSLQKEILSSVLLGTGVGMVLFATVYMWQREVMPGISIGSSVILSITMAGFFGLSIPALLHRTRLDPKVAAGPLVLCLTDLFTLFFYFSIASILL